MIEDPRSLGIANLIREIFLSIDMFFGMVQLEKADVFSDRTCSKISSDIFYHNSTVSGCNFCTSVIVTLLAAHRHLPEQNAESAHAINIFT